MWVVSQILLVIYFKLDNGANTCGIDFHFQNKKSDQIEGDLEEVEVNENEESIPLNSQSNSTSRVETEDVPEESSSSDKTEDESQSVINNDEPRGDKYFEFRVLEKLFISEFKVVSEEGR